MARTLHLREHEPVHEPEQDAAPVVAVLRLRKNFGLVIHGHSHWWAAGTEFYSAHDHEIIARLKRAGAQFED